LNEFKNEAYRTCSINFAETYAGKAVFDIDVSPSKKRDIKLNAMGETRVMSYVI
jgi:hypothetical protein